MDKKKLTIRQFANTEYRQYMNWFCIVNETKSKTLYGPNLFGGYGSADMFCSKFKLELVYG